MLQVLAVTIGLLPVLYFTGASVNSVFKLRNIIVSIIVGFSILLYISSLVATSVVVIEFLFLSLIVLTLIGIVLTIRKLNRQKMTIKRNAIFSFIIGYFSFTYFQSTNLFQQGLRLRTGPDIIGWLSSANYFRDQQNLEFLEKSINSQFKEMTDPNFYSLISYREQVQGEFLVGADRFGLPALLGFMSRVTPFSTTVVLLAFMGIFGGIVGVYLQNVSESNNLNNRYRFLLFLVVFGNLAIMNPIFEGGIWLVFILPITLILIGNLTSIKSHSDYVSIVLLLILLSFSATLNSDILPISIIFLFIFVLYFSQLRMFKKVFYLLMSPILLLPFINYVQESITQRVNDIDNSGWKPIYLITPIDIFGISPFTPSNLITNSGLSASVKITMIVVSISLSILLFHLLIGYFKYSKFIARTYLSLLLTILLLMYYQLFQGVLNHYFAWKISFLYASVLPSIIVFLANLDYQSYRAGRSFNFSRYLTEKSIQVFYSLIILCSILLPVNWFTQSEKNLIPTKIKFNSLSHGRLEEIFMKYEIEGFCGKWWQSIILLSDFKSSTISRNIVKDINPAPREKLFLIDVSYPQCANAVNNFSTDNLRYTVENLVFIGNKL